MSVDLLSTLYTRSLPLLFFTGPRRISAYDFFSDDAAVPEGDVTGGEGAGLVGCFKGALEEEGPLAMV